MRTKFYFDNSVVARNEFSSGLNYTFYYRAKKAKHVSRIKVLHPDMFHEFIEDSNRFISYKDPNFPTSKVLNRKVDVVYHYVKNNNVFYKHQHAPTISLSTEDSAYHYVESMPVPYNPYFEMLIMNSYSLCNNYFQHLRRPYFWAKYLGQNEILVQLNKTALRPDTALEQLDVYAFEYRFCLSKDNFEKGKLPNRILVFFERNTGIPVALYARCNIMTDPSDVNYEELQNERYIRLVYSKKIWLWQR